MWLIRISDMKLVEFPFDRPPYAILSHTWGPPQDEVLFDDMVSGLESARAKKAFTKVEQTCRLSQARKLEYCWIDTCCIDKRSSAELQEAINSMFEWYKSSEICFAYISDVVLSGCPSVLADNCEAEDSNGDWEDSDWDEDRVYSRDSRDRDSVAYSEDSSDSERNVSIASDDHFLDQFRRSRWFTRGWTLQELIAPAKVNFYDRDWEIIGSKTGNLVLIIQSITGIPRDFLRGQRKHTEASVAQRMYWASARETSRKEDIAYCLLGLFAINMPMLYGEGDNAFLRLEQEILNKIDDESIFAWLDREQNDDETGLLAEHPRYFANSGDIVPYSISRIVSQPSYCSGISPPIMTGGGLRLQKGVISLSDNLYVIPLRCTFRPSSSMADAHPTPHQTYPITMNIDSQYFQARFVIGILVRYSLGVRDDKHQRMRPGEFLSTAINHGFCGKPRTLFISQERKRNIGYGDHWFRSRISASGYSLEAVPSKDYLHEPEVKLVCITKLMLRKWVTLVFSVQFWNEFQPYEEPGEPVYECDGLNRQNSYIYPLLLRFNCQVMSTIWIGLHGKITELSKEHRKMGDASLRSHSLQEYARVNADTVILPGYRIESGPNSSYSSKFVDGKFIGPHTWDVGFLDPCSRFYTSRRPTFYDRKNNKQNVEITCEPIPKTEWHINPQAIFIVSLLTPSFHGV